MILSIRNLVDCEVKVALSRKLSNFMLTLTMTSTVSLLGLCQEVLWS